MSKLRHVSDGSVLFHCPGCDCKHAVQITHSSGYNWEFNGNDNAPTFAPSVKVSSYMSVPPVTAENLDKFRESSWEQVKVETVCHSFIADGKIQFLGDCTHSFANMTVDLPDLDKEIPTC